MVKYIKCPRCELNYIDSEKQEYCDVCIAELKGKKLQFADLEEEDFEELDAELEEEEEENTDDDFFNDELDSLSDLEDDDFDDDEEDDEDDEDDF